MKLRAKDLPLDGPPVQVTVDGVDFEVLRLRSIMDGRKYIYKARRLPAPSFDSGWWYRYEWALMVADLRLMTKTEDDR